MCSNPISTPPAKQFLLLTLRYYTKCVHSTMDKVYVKKTHHPQKSFRASSRYIISHQLETLMSINNLHNGHCTKQEKYYFTDFSSCVT